MEPALNRNKQIEDILLSFRTINQAIMKMSPTFLNKLGITITQMIILNLVENNKDISIKKLAERMDITSSAATQQVNILVKKGFLVREESNIDRRLVNIHTSEELDKKMETIKVTLLEQLYPIFSEITDEELEIVHKFTDKIVNNIQTELDLMFSVFRMNFHKQHLSK
jgi:DNA-binding MarR family transcriptional regulator